MPLYLVVFSAMLPYVGLATASGPNELPVYRPGVVERNAERSYQQAGGAINIACTIDVKHLLAELNAEFARVQPGLRFELACTPGVSVLDGLTTGVAALAVVSRAAWPMETRPFRQLHGYEATDVVIGRVNTTQPHPPAVYVHVDNPLAGLTEMQLGRVFAVGGLPGDLTHWRQLGLTGKWLPRRIHTYGRRDNGTAMTALRYEFWAGRPFTPNYEPLSDDDMVMAAVADDPFGIAIVSGELTEKIPVDVRPLSIVKQPADLAARGDAITGSYQNSLAPRLHVYVDRRPGEAVDPALKAYLDFLLSRQGQAVVSGIVDRDEGFALLSADEVHRERTRILQPALDDALPAFTRDSGLDSSAVISGSAPSILPELAAGWITGFRHVYPGARVMIEPPYGPPIGAKSPRLMAFLDGTLDFALLTRVMTEADRRTFQRVHGHSPLVVPVAGGSVARFGLVDAVAIVVNQANTIEQLSLAQVDALYSLSRYRGHAAALRVWGDLGLTGEWAARPIHVLGIPASIAVESARAAFLREKVLDRDGRQGVWRAPEDRDHARTEPIEEQVADDPCSIAYTGLGHLRAGIKPLALADSDGRFFAPTLRNVANWNYPLAREIYFVLAKPRDEARARLLREFLRYILSRDGQQVVRSQGIFLPLRAAQRERAMQMLDETWSGSQ